jgi:hypothetical protein
MQIGRLSEVISPKNEDKRTNISLLLSIVFCKKESCEINKCPDSDLAAR